MKKLVFGLSALLSLNACTPDDDGGGTTEPAPVARQAIIGIEGTSPNGISSIASYSITNQQVENNLFRKANINPMGQQLSDIMIDRENNLLAIVLPGSEKIVYANLNDYTLKGSTNNLLRINKVAQTAFNRYYITSAENEGIYIVNPRSENVVGDIQIYGTNPTDIMVWEDLAFISFTGDPIIMDSTIAIMRTTEDTLVTKLNVGRYPNSMVVDRDNNMYVLCAGDLNSANPALSGIGSLWKYNLDSMSMAIDSNFAIVPDTVLYFTDNQLKPRALTYDPNGHTLYYIGNSPTGDIFSMGASARRVSESPMVEGNFYNLAFDEVDQELYGLKTPNDIEEIGDLQIFDPVGNLKGSQRIGVKPRDVAFR